MKILSTISNKIIFFLNRLINQCYYKKCRSVISMMKNYCIPDTLIWQSFLLVINIQNIKIEIFKELLSIIKYKTIRRRNGI